jgi:hypothetical protein
MSNSPAPDPAAGGPEPKPGSGLVPVLTAPDPPPREKDQPPVPAAPSKDVGRLEGVLGAALPVALAAGVFIVAFAHVHQVAVWAGQPAWASWLIAVSVELMAFASILEIRHRRRARVGLGWPILTLTAGIGMSGAANLAAAGPHHPTGPPGVWTPVMALWPVAAFGLVAGLKATRPTHTGADRPASDHDRSLAGPDRSGAGPDRSGVDRDPQRPGLDDPAALEAAARLPAALIAAGWQVADDLTSHGRPVTRTALARGLRARGQPCSTDRAALLHALLRHPPGGADPPADDPADTSVSPAPGRRMAGRMTT